MKRFILAAAALAVPMFGSAAFAATVDFKGFNGDITMKIENFDVGRVYQGVNYSSGGTVYNNDPMNPNQLSTIRGNSPDPALDASTQHASEDGWGIFRITTIYQASNSNNIFYQTNQGGIDLVGIFWGEQDTTVVTQHVGGGLSGPAHDEQDSAGVGVNFAVFAVAANSWNPSLGTSGRGGTPTMPTYNTVTSGTPIWTFYSTNLQDDQGNNLGFDFLSLFDVTHTTSNGKAAAEVGAAGSYLGSENSQFVTKPGKPDLTFNFRGDPNPASGQIAVGDWLLQSQDPVQATVFSTPTPSSASMGALAMLGLAAGSLRRNRKTC